MNLRNSTIKRRFFSGAACVLAFVLTTLSIVVPAQAQSRLLENEFIVVGVDLVHGGAINELRLSGATNNLINTRDLGRYLQQSYYSGPTPFKPAGSTQHPAYANWNWNPVQAGDVYSYPSQVIDTSNNGVTLYVKSIPRQWALNGVNSECTMESWLRLDDNRVIVRNRLVNNRSDTTRYESLHQELPALYTVGTLHRLFTYTGPAPFTGDTLTQITNSGPPWVYWNSTENWSALVDDNDWGLGIYHPRANLTVGGFSGIPGIGGPSDNSTGYFAPLQQEVIDHDIVYEFSYTLIVGDLENDIRSYVYDHKTALLPNHSFRSNRQNCFPINLTDPSPPYDGFWPLQLDQSDPQIRLPLGQWQATEAPVIRIRAAYRTQQNTAEIFFAKDGAPFAGDQHVTFTIIPDGVVRDYLVDLSSSPNYTGLITHLRFDPLVSPNAGDEVDLYAVTTVAPAGVADHPLLPSVATLQGNYPNPFNPRTKIQFSLPTTGTVDLRIYDAAGRLVRILLSDSEFAAGEHDAVWDGRDRAGQQAASGAYFCRLKSASGIQSLKITLVE